MVKNNISYKIIQGFPQENRYKEIANLYSEIFEDADLEFFKQRINDNFKVLFVLAYSNKLLVGFKIGYTYNKQIYYSWIGGVNPKFRNRGLAKQMTKLQESYAKGEGYTLLRTKSMNRFKPMMILNLKNGFDIINVYTNKKGQTKIVFEKIL